LTYKTNTYSLNKYNLRSETIHGRFNQLNIAQTIVTKIMEVISFKIYFLLDIMIYNISLLFYFID